LWSLSHVATAKAPLILGKNPAIRVQVKVTSKKSAPAEKDRTRKKEQDRQSIVEAPLLPTQAPDVPAFLGAQNHRSSHEQKTQPKASARATDASALQNGPLRLKIETAAGGTIAVPTGKDYEEFLPKQIELLNTTDL
jgi:hypothetical protein